MKELHSKQPDSASVFLVEVQQVAVATSLPGSEDLQVQVLPVRLLGCSLRSCKQECKSTAQSIHTSGMRLHSQRETIFFFLFIAEPKVAQKKMASNQDSPKLFSSGT